MKMPPREWTEPLAALALEGAVFCAVFGPVGAAIVMAGCFVAGGPIVRWVGRKMFGAGGQ